MYSQMIDCVVVIDIALLSIRAFYPRVPRAPCPPTPSDPPRRVPTGSSAHAASFGLTRTNHKAKLIGDGSLRGSKGNAVRGSPRGRGCPRNCKRRALHHHVTGSLTREDGARAATREPGDLPSAVVTRETRWAGLSWRVSRRPCIRAVGEASFAVTCHSKRARDTAPDARPHRIDHCRGRAHPRARSRRASDAAKQL
jgi:hypothetical protein